MLRDFDISKLLANKQKLYIQNTATQPMLSRSTRLPSSEFLARGYRTQKTPYFSLKAKANNLSTRRIGVIISTAAVKSAVRRNFWKRQAKSILSDRSRQGIDVLLVFFRQADALTKSEFRKELLGAYSQISSSS
jgi:ribonuclease P protein component